MMNQIKPFHGPHPLSPHFQVRSADVEAKPVAIPGLQPEVRRALGASQLMSPAGRAHNPARDMRGKIDHQADARQPPLQAG